MCCRSSCPFSPAMCRGTAQRAILSILDSGLSPAGGQSVMSSIFLHWDARIGKGAAVEPGRIEGDYVCEH